MDNNAAHTLDQIRVGAGHMLLTAQQRLVEVKTALDEGRFGDALTACGSLSDKVGHLAHAQEKMGLVANGRIIKVGEVQDGMIVPGVGEVTNVGPCPGCGQDDCNNLSFTIKGQLLVFDRDLEMVVELPSDDTP